MSVSSMRCSSSPFSAVLQRAHPCQLRHPCLFSGCGTAQRVRKLLVGCKQLVVQSSAACYSIKQTCSASKKMLCTLVLDNRGSVGQQHTSFHCTATQEEGPCSTGRERAVGAWGRANGRKPGAQLKTRAPANTSASRRQAIGQLLLNYATTFLPLASHSFQKLLVASTVQARHARQAAEAVGRLVREEDWALCVTHGNGPQARAESSAACSNAKRQVFALHR